MKKSILISLLFSTVFMFSGGQNNDALLFGNWNLVAWYDDIPRDINKDGNSLSDLLSQWQGCKKQRTLVLSQDYTAMIVYTGAADNPKCPPGFKNGSAFQMDSWEITQENELVFKGHDYEDVYNIIELSSESLILKGSHFITCCDSDISYFTGGYLKFTRD